MGSKEYDAAFWKNEYEQLRRKKNKELDEQQIKLLKFLDKTWELLKKLGMKDKDILDYYRGENNICQH